MPNDPQTVTVHLTDLAELAVEAWRLQRWLDRNTEQPGAVAAVRHAYRHLRGFLRKFEVETLDLTGHTYDPGLAVVVVDSEENRGTSSDPVIITEMVAPVIMSRGSVIKNGQVVTGPCQGVREA